MAPAPKAPKKKNAPIDPWINSRDVGGLNQYLYDEYLTEKDVALVMFYDPADPQCEWSKKHFLKAAKTTVRENSAFCAVDCTREKELCAAQGIPSLPYFRLLSRGKTMASYGNPQAFLYHQMKGFVENAPIMEDPPGPCALASSCSLVRKIF